MTATATAGSPVMTEVLGYKNSKSFPLSINSDHLGINTQVGEKSYVLDREGRMINDPRLDHWAKQGLLSKEYSPTPVPLIMLPGSPVAPAAPGSGVALAPRHPVRAIANTGLLPSPKPDARRLLMEAEPPAPRSSVMTRMPVASPPSQTVSQPATGSSSVHTMTVEEAARTGVIPKPDRRERFERAPNESAEGPTAPRGAPYIDQLSPMPRAVIPAGMKFEKVPVDVSHVSDLGSDDVIGAATASVASDAGVALPPPPVPVRRTITVSAVTPSPSAPLAADRPSAQLDGKVYTTPGNLKKALLRKYGGDADLADEAYEQFRPIFAKK